MRNLLTILVCGAIGLVVCGVFLLPLEKSQREAAAIKAYHETQRLSQSGKPTDSEVVLSEIDPYGQPYRIVPLPDGGARVLSSGPNKSTPDADDIYPDMEDPPDHVYARKRNRQLLIAFGMGGLVWLYCSWTWIRSRRSGDDE